MSMIITTNRGGICGICQNEFGHLDQQITHIGGENHDGFHKTCLAKWVVLNPTCPYDKTPLDPNSLISRTDQIAAKLRPALTNAAYAACFGTTVSGTVAAVLAGGTALPAGAVPIVGIAVAGVAVGAIVGAGIGIDWILNRREVNQIARDNIWFGVCIGSLAGIAAVSFTPLSTPPAISLVGGVAAGILSLIRG